MSAEEVEGVIEWAAHHRLGQAVQSLLTYMQDVGYGVPQDENVRNRLWLAGLDDGARDSVTCEEFRDMLDTVQNFKQLLLESVTEKDYFHLLLRIKKQLLLAIIREQLQEKEIDETNIPTKVAKKLDLEEYWEVLNELLPRSSTRLSLSANASAAGGGGSARKQKASAARSGGGTEEDSFKEYCETKQEMERRSLMNICEEGDTSVPCATKIAILLESATRESFVHCVADFSKKAEETLGPPAALEFFPAGEDPALRVAQIRSKLVTMPRRDVVQSSRNQFKRQVADHLGPLLGKRGGAAAADDDDEEEEEEEEVNDRRVRSRRGGAAAAAAGGGGGGASARGGSAKEQRILEKRSENLQNSVRQRGGDPIDDFHHEDDDRMEEEEEEEKARGTKRKTSSKSGTAKDRLRYNDLRRKGRSINFEDSQYRGDDEDEEEEEEDAAARKAKKGRKPSKSKGDEEEDEIEDSEDEDDRRREHLRPPGKKQRYSLGTGLKKARPRPEKRKSRVPWEASEINCLKEAIQRFDLHGDWAKIRDLYKDHWKSDRTSVDIKDKWRNITTKVDKGQDNLDYKRVLKGLPK